MSTDPRIVTISDRQRSTKAGDYVEVQDLGATRRVGRLLQERSGGLPGGLWLHTVAIRWTGQGISVYRVLETRPSVRGATVWTLFPIHEGL